MADRLPLNVGFTEYWESTTTDFLWPISTVQANEQERPTPAVGTFVAQWLMYFVSGRPRISSGNAEFGESSRCRITASGSGEPQPNGRTSSRRRFAIDPLQPLALHGSRRSRRELASVKRA